MLADRAEARTGRRSAGTADVDVVRSTARMAESSQRDLVLDVVAFVGDNILDFPGLSQAAGGDSPSAFTEFGVRFFVLPNPMYGSWQ